LDTPVELMLSKNPYRAGHAHPYVPMKPSLTSGQKMTQMVISPRLKSGHQTSVLGVNLGEHPDICRGGGGMRG
jgi:hypothetical protein